MIANLGMYDMAQTRAANDTFWDLIRTYLGFGPKTLTRADDFWPIWQSPDLLFAQTCGYPFRARLHGHVQLVATPDYGLPNCPPGYYNSVFIRRRDNPRETLQEFSGTRFAFNEPLSQSGWAAPVHHMRALGLKPGALLQTGGHAKSLKAVLEGQADFAALDALTFAMLREHDSGIHEAITELEYTAPTPTLPFITAQGRDAEAIAHAVEQAISALPEDAKHALHFKGLVRIPTQTYLAVTTPPGPDSLI